MSNREEIKVEPIGFVRTKATGHEIRDKGNISEIVLRPELEDTLEGIEDFSHLFIIFWMHKIPEKDRMTMKVHPRGRRDAPYWVYLPHELRTDRTRLDSHWLNF